jgi:hypothetical protein
LGAGEAPAESGTERNLREKDARAGRDGPAGFRSPPVIGDVSTGKGRVAQKEKSTRRSEEEGGRKIGKEDEENQDVTIPMMTSWLRLHLESILILFAHAIPI